MNMHITPICADVPVGQDATISTTFQKDIVVTIIMLGHDQLSLVISDVEVYRNHEDVTVLNNGIFCISPGDSIPLGGYLVSRGSALVVTVKRANNPSRREKMRLSVHARHGLLLETIARMVRRFVAPPKMRKVNLVVIGYTMKE